MQGIPESKDVPGGFGFGLARIVPDEEEGSGGTAGIGFDRVRARNEVAEPEGTMPPFVEVFEFRRGAIEEAVEAVRFLEEAPVEAADGGRLGTLPVDFADVVDLREVEEACLRTSEEDEVVGVARLAVVRDAGIEDVEGEAFIVEADRTAVVPLGGGRMGVERGVGKGR